MHPPTRARKVRLDSLSFPGGPPPLYDVDFAALSFQRLGYRPTFSPRLPSAVLSQTALFYNRDIVVAQAENSREV